ncbi:MAG: ATP synthase subunit I [Coxiellaceae bacterium]|nr:ATP synthase subunit I [Coxiellaceae bacterium]
MKDFILAPTFDSAQDERALLVRAISTKKPLFAKEKRALFVFFAWQCSVAIAISAIAAFCWGRVIAVSVLQGGILAIVPALFLSMWFFLRSPKNPQKALRDVTIAEFLKIILLCLLFVVMLRYSHILFLPFLAGFCVTYAVYFIAPCVMKV